MTPTTMAMRGCAFCDSHLRVVNHVRDMYIVLPLCGFGERFVHQGYQVPKPLIAIEGKPLLLHILGRLTFAPDDEIVCIVPFAFHRYNGILDEIRAAVVVKLHWMYVHEPTQGAVDTCVRGLCHMKGACTDGRDLDGGIIVMDGDVVYATDVLQYFRDIEAGTDAAVTVHEDNSTTSSYSFVTTEPASNRVVDVAEKVRISNKAITGCYWFASVADFLQKAAYLLTRATYQTRGEFYMSSMIRLYLEQPACVRCIMLDASRVWCCGTPDQMHTHIARGCFVTHDARRRFCFDLDGTLVTTPRVLGDYSTVKPIHRTIAYLQHLHSQGHCIIIYTARRMRTHHGNVGKVVADIGKTTMDTLKEFRIPYDELVFGKPYADLYIDDKAVSPHSNVAKAWGVYAAAVPIQARAFNDVIIRDDTVVKRSSANPHKIRAEVHYYRNIPGEVAALFPKLLEADEAADAPSYAMERIHAPTASGLLVNEALSEDHLRCILQSLERVHEVNIRDHPSLGAIGFDDLDDHYMAKLKERTDHTDLRQGMKDLQDQVQHSIRFLQRLQQQRSLRMDICMIHGDPVFTNILCDGGTCKLIDMCGTVANMYTCLGERLYDYAKVLQSLLGYDEILQGVSICHRYKARLLRVFWEHVKKQGICEDHVRGMTHYLLLCLLPLHNPLVAEACLRMSHELYAAAPNDCNTSTITHTN